MLHRGVGFIQELAVEAKSYDDPRSKASLCECHDCSFLLDIDAKEPFGCTLLVQGNAFLFHTLDEVINDLCVRAKEKDVIHVADNE